jgi:hypothetical protein
MSRLSFALTALALLAGASPAAATATLSCDGKAGGVRFDFMGSVGSENTLSVNHAKLTPPLAKPIPADGRLGAYKIGATRLTFHLRWGDDKKPAADLVLTAQQVKEEDFSAWIDLKIAGRRVRWGAARCQLGY